MEDMAESGLLSFCFPPYRSIASSSPPLPPHPLFFSLAILFVHFYFLFFYCLSFSFLYTVDFINPIIRNSSREIGVAFPDKVALLNSAWFDPYIHNGIYANNSFLPSQEVPPPPDNTNFIIGVRFAFPDGIVLPDTA